jgi:hypothetical protein
VRNQIDELIKAEIAEHEKKLADLKKMATTLEVYFNPFEAEVDVKRPRLDFAEATNTTLACIPKAWNASWQPPPIKSVVQGIAAQVFQALLRELSSRGRLCT